MPPPFQRHFTFKHPLFKRQKSASGEWWEHSVYYLWWEFLRRHEGYKKTCEIDGKGKYAKLYDDFGNVHGVTFKEWWTKGGRGARLFSEPPLSNSVMVVHPTDIDALSESWKSGAVLVVAIPLALRKRFIIRKFSTLLRKHHTRRRGQRTFRESLGALSNRSAIQPSQFEKDFGCVRTPPKCTQSDAVGDCTETRTWNKADEWRHACGNGPQEERSIGCRVQETRHGTQNHRWGWARGFSAFSMREKE